MKHSVHLMLPLCVVVQLALYRLAAFDSEHSFRFGEIDYITGHLVCHVLIRLQSFGFHLGHGTLDDVHVLQRQKWDKEVHQVLVNQACMPQATYRKKSTDTCSFSVKIYHQIWHLNDKNTEVFI